MADSKKIIMAWGKCKVEIGDTGENDAFATTLFNVGTIKDQTTTLTSRSARTHQPQVSRLLQHCKPDLGERRGERITTFYKQAA